MADPPAPAQKAGGSFWTHKLGPFPVWVWGLALGAAGAYYWYTHYGPGASKQTGTAQQQPGQPVKITETIRNYGRRGPGRRRKPVKAGTAATAQAPNVGLTPPGPNPGGPDKRPGRKDKDKDKDKDRRGQAPAVAQQQDVTITQTGQPVSPDTGQPVYWEWTHAHRPPEVSYPVPAPQPAYAPGTTGATYATSAASTASTASAGADAASILAAG